MVLKRPFGEEEEGDGFTLTNQEAKRRIASSKFAQTLTPSQDFASTLEPLIRRWVRDEVQRSFQSFFCTLPSALEPCRKTSLQLRFHGKLPNTFFTGGKIESENSTAVKLVLFDSSSNEVVSSGPLSSLKIEIVPLDGDFSPDDDEDWSEKDFDAKVIYARDGRRPLMTGDLVVTLENGVANLGDLYFTDNSSWRRSRKFMVGARAKGAPGVRIREARSQAFVVKDHRGESYKKHHPPSLGDEIWRLEKIAKDGVSHKRLVSHGICTVKGFLQMYFTNQSTLRKLLGGSSNKTWETVIKHANACVLDDKLYLYRCDTQGIGLLVDSIFKIVGATMDGLNYLSLDELSVLQMPVVEASKQRFYKNLAGQVPIDDPSVLGILVPMSKLHHAPLNTASFSLQEVAIPALHQDEVDMEMYGVVNSSTGMGHELGSMKYFSPALRDSFIMKEFNNGAYYSEDVGGDFDIQIGTSLWQGNDPSSQTVDFGICFSGNGSPRARWCKIRAALKWGSVRRDAAAKRMAQLCYLDFLV